MMTLDEAIEHLKLVAATSRHGAAYHQLRSEVLSKVSPDMEQTEDALRELCHLESEALDMVLAALDAARKGTP